MKVIIGGVERKINQVSTYCKENDIKDKSVGDVLEASRSDRLLKKIYHKSIFHDIIGIASSDRDFVHVPSITLYNPKHLDKKTNVKQEAKRIEHEYAIQARDLLANKI